MMRRTLAAICAVWTVSATLPAQAADLRDLLRRSVTAERKYSYQGQKLLTRRQGAELVRYLAKVYHRAPDRTLLVAADGELAGSRVLSIGSNHYVQVRDRPYQHHSLSPPAANTALLLTNYNLRQMRVEPIAGRKCVMVSVEPKHPGNPRKLIWLDVRSALPLKTQVWTPEGQLREETTFLTLQYHPKLSPAMFSLPNHAQVTPKNAKPNFTLLNVSSHGLPPGYRLAETATRQLPDGKIVAIQHFSDGLNTLTLLQSTALTKDQLANLGGSAAILGQVGSVRYALCGEQQPAVLKGIASALRPSNAPPARGRPKK